MTRLGERLFLCIGVPFHMFDRDRSSTRVGVEQGIVGVESSRAGFLTYFTGKSKPTHFIPPTIQLPLGTNALACSNLLVLLLPWRITRTPLSSSVVLMTFMMETTSFRNNFGSKSKSSPVLRLCHLAGTRCRLPSTRLPTRSLCVPGQLIWRNFMPAGMKL